MSFLHIHFSEIDTQIAQFARAIALPIRVFILRMIAENGNALTRQAFYNHAFSATTINKHILELRALGIIKVKTVKAQVTYYIDQGMYNRMSANFTALFEPVMPDAAEAALLTIAAAIPTAINFGAYIKEQRMEMKLSQATLAELLGIDRALLSRIETGKKELDVQKLPLLAEALYMDMAEMNRIHIHYRML